MHSAGVSSSHVPPQPASQVQSQEVARCPPKVPASVPLKLPTTGRKTMKWCSTTVVKHQLTLLRDTITPKSFSSRPLQWTALHRLDPGLHKRWASQQMTALSSMSFSYDASGFFVFCSINLSRNQVWWNASRKSWVSLQSSGSRHMSTPACAERFGSLQQQFHLTLSRWQNAVWPVYIPTFTLTSEFHTFSGPLYCMICKSTFQCMMDRNPDQ